MTETSFENKCEILSDLWMSYRFNPRFDDFCSYNDIGLPLAFLLSESLVRENSPLTKSMVEETFDVFLASLKVEDVGYDSLDDVLVDSPEWNG